jgi:hypothetical protein
MDSQAVVALVCSAAAGVAGLVYFLINSLKQTVEDAIDSLTVKMDAFVKEVSDLRERLGERTVALSYIEKRLDSVEIHCKECRKHAK